jgi:hypothetical protein
MKEVERITGKSPMQLQHEKVVKVRESVTYSNSVATLLP